MKSVISEPPANHIRNQTRTQRGFTLLEVMLAMGILGIVLAVASALMQSTQGASNTQQARTSSLNDGRAAMSRISETISRAAYIYPKGITITVTSGLIGTTTANSITTGNGALAMLVSDGLGGTTRKYYGVVFYVTDRSKTKFAPDLPSVPSNRIGQSVLVEARTAQTGAGPISWAVNANPATAANAWATSINEGVMADGVVSADTNLMASAVFSPAGGMDDTVFSGGLQGNNPALTLVNARILGVAYNLSVQVAPAGKTLANTGATVLRGLATSRTTPRR